MRGIIITIIIIIIIIIIHMVIIIILILIIIMRLIRLIILLVFTMMSATAAVILILRVYSPCLDAPDSLGFAEFVLATDPVWPCELPLDSLPSECCLLGLQPVLFVAVSVTWQTDGY